MPGLGGEGEGERGGREKGEIEEREKDVAPKQ